MFEIIGTFVVLTILFFVIGGIREEMLVNIQKKDKEKDFEKRVTNVICMIVIMTDCCLSFYKA